MRRLLERHRPVARAEQPRPSGPPSGCRVSPGQASSLCTPGQACGPEPDDMNVVVTADRPPVAGANIRRYAPNAGRLLGERLLSVTATAWAWRLPPTCSGLRYVHEAVAAEEGAASTDRDPVTAAAGRAWRSARGGFRRSAAPGGLCRGRGAAVPRRRSGAAAGACPGPLRGPGWRRCRVRGRPGGCPVRAGRQGGEQRGDVPGGVAVQVGDGVERRV